MDIVADANKKFSATIIMVLHDLNHARLFSDEILIVKAGKKFAAGDPKKILTAKTLGEVFDVEADTFTNAAGDEIIFPTQRKIYSR